MININKKDLLDVEPIFKKVEEGVGIYNRTVNLLNKRYELEAVILLLAVWNKTYFSKSKGKDIDKIDCALNELKKEFDILSQNDIRYTNLDEIKEKTKKIYNKLNSIRGVGHTGASKIMHLKCRKLFV